jgi:hypothetical protein
VIELYSGHNGIVKAVRQAVAGVCEVEVHSPPRKDVMRGSFDLVATTGQLNAGLERFAAQFGAMPLVLPEAAAYLGEKGNRGYVAVLGADYRDVKF